MIRKVAFPILTLLYFFSLVTLSADASVPGYFHKEGHSNLRGDHSAWGLWLEDYLYKGEAGIMLLDYKSALLNGRDELDSYLNYLMSVKVTDMKREEQMAFWINLYNALTVDLILDHPDIDSIRKIKDNPFSIGPWNRKLVSVESVSLSLNDIEHKILRPYFSDPRIHFAVNCASLGCPDLRSEAFDAKGLERQLDQAARDFLSHPRAVRLEGKTLHLSSLFKWYSTDFGSGREDLLFSLSRWADPDTADQIKNFEGRIRYSYDWSLNGSF